MARRQVKDLEKGGYDPRLRKMPRILLEMFSNNEIPLPIFDLLISVFVPGEKAIRLTSSELRKFKASIEK